MEKFADFIDELAYQHVKQAYYDSSVDLNEYMRAATRADFLKGWAMFAGKKSYSYYKRIGDELECETGGV